MTLVIGVPAETVKGEHRVAIDPATAKKIAEAGYSILVQKGAGKHAHFPDSYYREIAGVSIAPAAKVLKADLVIKIQPPTSAEVRAMKKSAVLISYIHSESNGKVVNELAKKQVDVLAMELIPRITRAQSMDTLSSQAAIAGYKAVLRAADVAPIFFPMLTYAAGSIRPAKVLVIGTGVAGLQAIATAKRLGAQVEAYDVRPETREQVESLGARFVHIDIEASGSGGYARELTKEEIKIQQDTLKAHIARSNVLITTAAVPGKPAPRIVSKAMVETMAAGSVIIDLGAEGGGNVELTKTEKVVNHKGVAIVGMTNVASTMPVHASEMYGKNIYNLLNEIFDQGAVTIDPEDEVIAGCLLIHKGKKVHPILASMKKTAPAKTRKKAKPTSKKAASTKSESAAKSASSKTSKKKSAARAKADTSGAGNTADESKKVAAGEEAKPAAKNTDTEKES